MKTTKQLAYLIIAASALVAEGCMSDGEKRMIEVSRLNKEITKDFKLVSGPDRYREHSKASHFSYNNMPEFMDPAVRRTHVYDNNTWVPCIPAGKYVIDGLIIDIEYSAREVYAYFNLEPQRGAVKNNSGLIDIMFGVKSTNVSKVSFNKRTYVAGNREDAPVIDSMNAMMHKFLPIIDSIDKAEVKQYQDFRANYIAQRNDSVASSMKKAMLLR